MSRAGRAPKSQLSIGIVCASISRKAGGILPIMQAHAKELVRQGVNVVVHGIADELTEADRASWAPATVIAHHPYLQRFAYAQDLDRSLAEANYDVVHQHGLWLYPSIATSRWRRRTRRPVMISAQGMLEPWALANSRSKKVLASWAFERNNLTNAACIHCSEAEVEGIRAFGLTTPIAVIPNGADLPDLNTKHARPAWLPDDGRRTLLYLGRIHPKKGIRQTLDAWAILRAHSPEVWSGWRLVVAGWDDGGHVDSLIAHARALGLDEVLFPGPIYSSEKESLLAHAGAFILASHSEGQPMAVLEAWSRRLPVFMTRHCNLSVGFEQGAAIEVSTDPVMIAATLAEHLPRTDLPDVGSRGRDLVVERFSWDRVGRDLCSVYRWLRLQESKPENVIPGTRDQ